MPRLLQSGWERGHLHNCVKRGIAGTSHNAGSEGALQNGRPVFGVCKLRFLKFSWEKRKK